MEPSQPSAQHHRRNAIAIAVGVVVVIAAVVLTWRQHILAHGIVTLGDDAPIRVDIAHSFFTRERGLSRRPSLDPDEGMLFVFETPARYSFWMKEMHFPLDIVWINDGEIVDITTDVPPPASGQVTLPTYFPLFPANQVLELNAGYAKAHGLRTGMMVNVQVER